jgi:hypothetical protein
VVRRKVPGPPQITGAHNKLRVPTVATSDFAATVGHRILTSVPLCLVGVLLRASRTRGNRDAVIIASYFGVTPFIFSCSSG